MGAAVFLNGRFLHQAMTGVQRFSAEIVTAIDRLAAAGEWPETLVLSPRAGCGGLEGFSHLGVKQVGRMRGHLWEQTELPQAARNGVLVSLGNTGPVLAGRRQVVVIHDAGVFDTPESYSLRFRSWYRALQHTLVRTGAQIATVSEFSRARIVARLGIEPERVSVVYEAADHILRVARDPTTLERHGLVPRQYALVVSSRVAHKNLLALQEAATALERRGMTIAIVGGTNRQVFQSLPGCSLLERALGRVSDSELRVLYENAACLVFPSRYEGFGLPPVEAMACGCPVLAAHGNAVEEICGDGALYFPNDDSRRIVDVVERLLDEEGLADRLRARGRERAAALSWESSARALGRVVTQLQ
jgi:glycosyltransferase involved in cell wall biosynthesis